VGLRYHRRHRSSGRRRRGASRSSARRWSGGSSRRRYAANSPSRAPGSTAVSVRNRSSGPTVPLCRHRQARSSGLTPTSCRRQWRPACTRMDCCQLHLSRGRGQGLSGARDLVNGSSSVRRGGPCRRRSRSISSSRSRSSPARGPRSVRASVAISIVYEMAFCSPAFGSFFVASYEILFQISV
jgi:hypothetical protein